MTRRIICSVLFVCIWMTTACYASTAVSDNSISLPIIDIADNFSIETYHNTLPLDQRIRCAAIDSNGNVAFRSGSSGDTCDYIITVYSKEGEFLYGYEVRFKYQRGYGVLYFNTDDELCYSAAYSSNSNPTQDVLIVFEPHSTQYSSFAIHDNEQPYSDCTIDYTSDITISTSKKSCYSVNQCSYSSFSLKNTDSNEVFSVYDQSEVYQAAQKAQNRIKVVTALISIIFLFALGWLLSKCKDNLKQ